MNLNSYKIKKVSVEQVDRVDPDWKKQLTIYILNKCNYKLYKT